MEELEELENRRTAIAKSLTERNLLTDELAEKIAAAETFAGAIMMIALKINS